MNLLVWLIHGTIPVLGGYPTAAMYLVYAVLVIVGFFVWKRASATVDQVGTVAAEPAMVST